ncbi:MAG: hypothetical protein FD119_1330 [Stygiobacter sp.]|nr:MAG: hypothetical protein FD119_1330 [Stygiobacter sp.]
MNGSNAGRHAFLRRVLSSIRLWAIESTPRFLHPTLRRLSPPWLLALAVVAAIALAFSYREGLQSGWNYLFNHKQWEDERPLTKGDMAQLLQELDKRRSPDAPPPSPDAEAVRNAAIRDLATSRTPTDAEAVREIKAGDIDAAIATLERGAQADMAQAAEKWRRLGALVYDIDLAKAKHAYEQAFALDAADFSGAIFLSRLRQRAGDLNGALKAANAAVAAAGTQRERMVASSDLGDLRIEAGDLAAARRFHQDGLDLAQALARDNPASAETKRDLWVSFNKLGDVAQQAGDLAGARRFFQDALDLAQALARDNPASAEAKRDLSVTCAKPSPTTIRPAPRPSAISRSVTKSWATSPNWPAISLAPAASFRTASTSPKPSPATIRPAPRPSATSWSVTTSWAKWRNRPVISPPPAASFRTGSTSPKPSPATIRPAPRPSAISRSVSTTWVTSPDRPAISLAPAASIRTGSACAKPSPATIRPAPRPSAISRSLAAARRFFQDGLDLRQALARDNPASAEAKRDLLVSYENLGDVARQAGDLTTARRFYQDRLDLAQDLASDNPASAEAKRDLWVSYIKLGGVAAAQGNISAAIDWYEHSLPLARQLAADNPSHPGFGDDLRITEWNLAALKARR